MYFHLLFALSINSLPVLIDAQQSDSGDQGNFLDQQLQGISQQASGQQNQAAPQGSQQDGQQGGDQGGPGGDQSGYQLGAAIAIGSSQGSQSGAGIAIGSPQGDQSGYPQSPSVVQLPQCSQQQYGYWTYGRDGQLVYKLYSGQLGHWVLGQYGSPIYVSKSIRDCSSYCSCGQSCPYYCTYYSSYGNCGFYLYSGISDHGLVREKDQGNHVRSKTKDASAPNQRQKDILVTRTKAAEVRSQVINRRPISTPLVAENRRKKQ